MSQNTSNIIVIQFTLILSQLWVWYQYDVKCFNRNRKNIQIWMLSNDFIEKFKIGNYNPINRIYCGWKQVHI